MARVKIDWSHHLAAYRTSSQSAAAYCAAAGLNPGTFQYHRYKAKRQPPKGFEAFTVTSELVIGRDQRGSLTLSGFDLNQLPGIVAAWSHALSQ